MKKRSTLFEICKPYYSLLLAHKLSKAALLGLVLWLSSSSLILAQTTPPGSQGVSLSGTLNIVWGDPPGGAKTGAATFYTLAGDDGSSYRLSLDPKLVQDTRGVAGLFRKRVSLTGLRTASATPAGATSLTVQSIQLDRTPGRGAVGVTGTRPFISLMCKFSDFPADEPQPISYFTNQLSNTKPGFNNYFREISYNATNLDNSTASGWYVLPNNKAYYNNNVTNTNQLGLTQIAQDCAGIAATGQGAIPAITNFDSFYGINFMLNTTSFNGSAYGGSENLTLNGVTRSWSATWMPYDLPANYATYFQPSSWTEHSVLGHEMSHAFGSPHSGSTVGYEYGNSWDVVSATEASCTLTGAVIPPYGCLSQGVMSYNKDVMGFIPASRKFTFNPTSGTQTITLDNLAQPASNTSYIMAVIPSLASPNTRYYTVEARYRLGYDTKLPTDAIIIHDVDTTRTGPVPWLIVPPGAPLDAVRQPNAPAAQGTGDAGAAWKVGNTFTDALNHFSVSVVSTAANTFTITINPIATLNVTSPTDDGTGKPNTLSAAINAATAGQNINLNVAGGKISVTGSLPALKAGVNLLGTCVAGKPGVTLDGTGISGTVDGLVLKGGSIVSGLNVRGFTGSQIKATANGSTKNRLVCVVASRT